MIFFFFNDTATTEIYTLSLHDALPILAPQLDGRTVETVESLADDDRLTPLQQAFKAEHALQCGFCTPGFLMTATDRKSTRLNSSHANISYAVFCLKKKNKYTLQVNNIT